jgi:transcriptional regulator with PAS, ATPase and Fis domain
LITPEHLAIGPGTRRAARITAVAGSADEPQTSSVVESRSQAAVSSSASDLKSLERDTIERTLQRVRFNKSRAAKDLGLSRQQLYLRMKKHGLE